jgi:hypothetical protein
MATVIRSAVIDAPADHCWDALRDFGTLSQRLGPRTAALMDAGLNAMKATLEGRAGQA